MDASQIEHEVVAALEDRVAIVRRCWRFDIAGGFNRKWRLELPQALACAAGSYWCSRRSRRSVRRPARCRAPRSASGARRASDVSSSSGPSSKGHSRTPSESPRPHPPDSLRARAVREAQILDTAIERAIKEEAARRSERELAEPSLLGRLRTAMREEPESALGTVADLAGAGEPSPQAAGDRSTRALSHGNGERLSGWLRGMAGEQNDEPLAMF